MSTSMVITNLRLPKTEYIQMKILAANAGVSVNEYIRKAVKQSAVQKMMAVETVPQKSTVSSFYDDMLKLAKSAPHVKVYDVSDDDAIIYNIYDE